MSVLPVPGSVCVGSVFAGLAPVIVSYALLTPGVPVPELPLLAFAALAFELVLDTALLPLLLLLELELELEELEPRT